MNTNSIQPQIHKPVFDLLSLPIIHDLVPLKNYFQCPICYNYYTDIYRPNLCEHYFCLKCIIKWSKIKKTCPLCRTSYNYLINY